MDFDTLLHNLLLIEGDIVPKHVFFYHRKPEDPIPVYPEPKGPLIDKTGGVWRHSLKSVIETGTFIEDFKKGTPDSQEFLQKAMAGWSADKYPIKRELKHTLEGGGMIWDVSHRNPSIKVKFDLDGSTRTLRFRNVWWSYGEYDRHMN